MYKDRIGLSGRDHRFLRCLALRGRADAWNGMGSPLEHEQLHW